MTGVTRRDAATYAAAVIVLLLLWSAFTLVVPPLFLPSPLVTLRAAVTMAGDPAFWASAGVSLARILSGWAIGGVIGSVLGIALGRSGIARSMILPVVEFFRFVPPITLVTLFIIWFGVGESSKVLLVVWTAVFIVVVNAAAGAASVREGTIRAARCLGATRAQVLFHVVIPEAVPFVVTGWQIALGNAFMAIVAAEMLAAKSGLGFMIWDAQIYARIDRMFVAFVALSLMGFATDRLSHALARRWLGHYSVV